jgi:hypothetical protein
VKTAAPQSTQPSGVSIRWLLQAIVAAFFFFSRLNSPSFAQETRRVRLAYSAFSVAFLNLFVARDAGLFKKHGIDVELIQMAGPLPIAALSAGEIDYLTGFTTGLVAASQGAPLKGVMVTEKTAFLSGRGTEHSESRRTCRQADRRRSHRQPSTSGCRLDAQSQRRQSRKGHFHPDRIGFYYGNQSRPRGDLGGAS